MPFVRFSRDKRGYEYVYLIDAPPVGRSGSRSRVLYWYRTPPGVKVGREPFDAPVRAALEAQNPDVAFDWKKILEAQAPAPPEVEHWRERRRAERSAKMARAARREEPGANAAGETDSLPEDQAEEAIVEPPTSTSGFEVARAAGPDGRDGAGASSPEAPRGRRRRRGGRRRRNSAQGQAAPAVATAPLEPPSGPASAESGGPDDETDPPIRPS